MPDRMTEHEARVVRADVWAKTVKGIVTQVWKWSVIGWCFYQVQVVLVAAPGSWDLQVHLGPFSFTVSVALAVAGFSISYARRQKQLRKDRIDYMLSRNADLERRLDPERTSSGPDSSGEAPEEDDR